MEIYQKIKNKIKNKFYVGDDLITLFKKLANDQTVEELDIGTHSITYDELHVLMKTLITNKKIKKLSILLTKDLPDKLLYTEPLIDNRNTKYMYGSHYGAPIFCWVVSCQCIHHKDYMYGTHYAASIFCSIIDCNCEYHERYICSSHKSSTFCPIKNCRCGRYKEKKVELEYRNIDEVGWKDMIYMLRVNSTLQELRIENFIMCNTLFQELEDALKKNTSLEMVSLRNMRSDEKMILCNVVVNVLKTNSRIHTLSLYGANIGFVDEGCDLIVNALKENTSLRSLSLGSNNLGVMRMVEMGNMLTVNTVLENLDLKHNNICAKGFNFLASGLDKNTTLKTLVLSGNYIGNKSHKLRPELYTNLSLLSLNLSENSFRNKDVDFLKILVSNSSLISLNIKYNNIKDVSILINELVINTTLTSLYMCGNKLKNDSAYHLAFALLRNTTLSHISMKNNYIRHEGIDALQKTLQVNERVTLLDVCCPEDGMYYEDDEDYDDEDYEFYEYRIEDVFKSMEKINQLVYNPNLHTCSPIDGNNPFFFCLPVELICAICLPLPLLYLVRLLTCSKQLYQCYYQNNEFWKNLYYFSTISEPLIKKKKQNIEEFSICVGNYIYEKTDFRKLYLKTMVMNGN